MSMIFSKIMFQDSIAKILKIRFELDQRSFIEGLLKSKLSVIVMPSFFDSIKI